MPLFSPGEKLNHTLLFHHSACGACFSRRAARRQASLTVVRVDPLAVEPTFISPTQVARARVEAEMLGKKL